MSHGVSDFLAGLIAGMLILAAVARIYWVRAKGGPLLLKPGQMVDFYDPYDPRILRARMVLDSYTETLHGREMVLVDFFRHKVMHVNPGPIEPYYPTEENNDGS